jgi:hypothetical protein
MIELALANLTALAVWLNLCAVGCMIVAAMVGASK